MENPGFHSVRDMKSTCSDEQEGCHSELFAKVDRYLKKMGVCEVYSQVNSIDHQLRFMAKSRSLACVVFCSLKVKVQR